MKPSDTEDEFYGKLLLFGEYSILAGGQAITVPLKIFSGKLDFYDENMLVSTPEVAASADNLKKFLAFLRKSPIGISSLKPDLYRFATDMEKGMFFNSNIPSGYGVGSSGALVAAIFHKYYLPHPYRYNLPESLTLNQLQKLFAQMESYFHGNSSGIDPLSSFLGKPLLLDSQGHINIKETGFTTKHKGWFLIDSGSSRNTGLLVQEFHKSVQSGQIDAEILKAVSNSTLNAFISGDTELLSLHLNQLSEFQLQNMKIMIPENIQEWWKDGLSQGIFNLKLCGSGGGGFYLGFACAIEQTRQYFAERNRDALWLMIGF